MQGTLVCLGSNLRGSKKPLCLLPSFEDGEQAFGRIDAAIYRNTKGDPHALAIAEDLADLWFPALVGEQSCQDSSRTECSVDSAPLVRRAEFSSRIQAVEMLV